MKKNLLLFLTLVALQSLSAQWTKLPAFPGDKETIIGGDGRNLYAYDNWSTHITSDKGLTKTIFLNGKRYAVEFSGSNVFLGGWQTVVKTSDAGKNFTSIATGLANTKILTFKMKGLTLFAGTDGGGVYSSADDGANWTNVSTGFQGQQSASQQSIYKLDVDGATLYAATNYGLYRSMNEGLNWELASKTGWPNGLPNTPSSLKAFDVKGGLMVAAPSTYPLNSSVYVSTDAGANWVNKTNGLPTTVFYPAALQFVGNTILLGTDIGMFKSNDNGDNWMDISNGLTNVNVNSIFSDGTTLFIGTGNGLWSRPVTDVATGISNAVAKENSYRMYPNPAFHSITIESSSTDDAVTARFYNTQGQLVLSKQLFNAENVVDLHSISVGSYFVKLISKSGTVTQKLIKSSDTNR